MYRSRGLMRYFSMPIAQKSLFLDYAAARLGWSRNEVKAKILYWSYGGK